MSILRFVANILNNVLTCLGLASSQGEDEKEYTIRANNAALNSVYPSNYIRTSKYNLITFIPLNLFEQFQRVANLYFLLQIIIMSIPHITSLSPSSTAVPLMFVLLATMVKDGYDDYGRHKSDGQLNNQETLVLDDEGKFVKRKWQEVMTGDIIKVENDESIAADVLALSTSEETGLLFIETAELDGETNLKVRQPLNETYDTLQNEKNLANFKGEVVCELPNNRLERFQGNLHWNDETYALDNNNIVLRGCVLRNTQWIYGLVVYAGHDSKLMMNSGKGIFKRTKLDIMTNYLVIRIAVLLALICTLLSVLTYVWENDTGRDFQQYLPWDSFMKDSPALIAVINWPGFIMVLNTLIPISLYISIEVIRLGQSWLVNWDLNLYHSETNTPALARNTTLTEELGQIQYIFSDKTGTLTQNVMMFKECSINGRKYGHNEEKDDVIEDYESHVTATSFVDFSSNKYADQHFKFADQSLKDDVDQGREDVVEFFRLLALCHTVMVEEKEKVTNGSSLDLDETDFVPGHEGDMGNLEYQAQSPDEGALVTAARNFGIVFKSRTPNSVNILVNGKEEIYELLCILDFDNVRKRMSVVVRRNNRIMLYCKGADTIIYELLSKNSKDIMTPTQQHLDVFACEGLRTLCLASKELSEGDYKSWLEIYNSARTATEDRDEKLLQAFCEIEQDLDLLGATAIEDKLQDGVPGTIANLAEANIKIWVLTGDKQETAINIGYSSMLLTENMLDVFVIEGEDQETVQQNIIRFTEKMKTYDVRATSSKTPDIVFNDGYRDEEAVAMDNVSGSSIKEGFALVIPGKSLAFALLPDVELKFLELALACKAIICCRVTPLQKALVVELVKRNVKATTLAIGDGANDVSMIKAAHIGVGISGKEGRQAVLAADYSFAQFRFLERLLLVHGRWSYWRMAKFLNYFFYKNFAFTLVQFWYNLFTGYSAQTLYNDWFLSLYNVCFTSLPVLATGIFDQDVSDEKCLQSPKLYLPGQKNRLFNNWTFARKLLHGTVTSCILFFLPYGIYNGATNTNGLVLDLKPEFAVAVGAILVIVVNLQMALDTLHWTWINHFFTWGSIIFYFLYAFLLYSTTIYNMSPSTFPDVGAAVNTFSSGLFWASLVVTSVTCLWPVVGYRWTMQKRYPTLADQIRKGVWKEKRSKSTSLLLHKKTRQSLRARPGSHRSGFAFSQQPGLGELIMSRKWLPKINFNKKSRSFDVAASSSDANNGGVARYENGVDSVSLNVPS